MDQFPVSGPLPGTWGSVGFRFVPLQRFCTTIGPIFTTVTVVQYESFTSSHPADWHGPGSAASSANAKVVGCTSVKEKKSVAAMVKERKANTARFLIGLMVKLWLFRDYKTNSSPITFLCDEFLYYVISCIKATISGSFYIYQWYKRYIQV